MSHRSQIAIRGRYHRRTGCPSRARWKTQEGCARSRIGLCRGDRTDKRTGVRYRLSRDRGRSSRRWLRAAAMVGLSADLVVQRTPAKRMFAASELPSAKTPSRDILFHRVHRGRNPAECGHSWRIVRTTAPGPRGHFGPVSVSRGPLSPTQPNHGHFGTDVESSIIQRVGGRPKGIGFERIPLWRSAPGSNRLVQCVCFRPQSGSV
jgi:hypothetical protein